MHDVIRSARAFEESNSFGLSRSQRTKSNMFSDSAETQIAQPMNEEDFWLGLYGAQ